MSKINKQIFRSYDIRGLYPTEINEEAAYAIGRATVIFLKATKVAVGRDMRRSSPSLFEELVRGITDEGADVYDLGLTSTPMLYFASGTLDADAAISLTASHNPPEYNGVKICRKDAVPVGGKTGLMEIRDIAMADTWTDVLQKGVVTKKDISSEYYAHLAVLANFNDTTFNIAIDTANAMGILELPLFEQFTNNINVVETLYGQFDENFPNHEANPLKTETLAELQRSVKQHGADIGVAFDGDADRVGFVDETGAIVPMDIMTALLVVEVLRIHPGATVLYDLRSTNSVREIVEENGGVAHECMVGHANIKAQMREEDAVFAGELSGHYYFKENFMAEAGALPVILLLNLLARTKKPLSQLVREATRYAHSKEINSEVADTNKVLDELKKKYAGGKVSHLDGIKVEFEDWWFNVRASNTEPVIRLNVEATNEKLLQEKEAELLAIIRA